MSVSLNATDTLIASHAFPERGSSVEYRCASILPGGQVATAVVDRVAFAAMLSDAQTKESFS